MEIPYAVKPYRPRTYDARFEAQRGQVGQVWEEHWGAADWLLLVVGVQDRGGQPRAFVVLNLETGNTWPAHPTIFDDEEGNPRWRRVA